MTLLNQELAAQAGVGLSIDCAPGPPMGRHPA